MLIYQRSIQKKWYNILNIIKYVGQSVCQALPFFYAFSDCDTVSSFHGIGKCTWWDALMNYASKDDLTGIFSKLSMTPNCITDQDMIAILDFMKSAYFSPDDVNENLSSLRLKYFLHRCDDNFKKIAPSYSALCMHVKRACYQAGYLWAECLCDVSLPNPCEWGWMRDNEGHLAPQWLPESVSVDHGKLLVTCSCKTKKCKNCKCAKLCVACLPQCKCFGECSRK